MAYQGTSIVDYLKSVGQSSDYASRAKLAEEQGIVGYGGTSEQNTQLLGKLNKPSDTPEQSSTPGWQQSPFQQGASFGNTQLNGFVPEADDNIDISQGETSLLQGSQSRWFEIFQNSYVAGQDTIQQGIVDLQKQQADITQRTRDTYQANIDKAQTGIDELEEETYGRELKEELSEEYEIKEKIDRLGELGRQMAQLQGAYDSSVSETEMSGITIGQSRGELARKQRKYAERASLIQIESAMITNQVNLAKDIIQNTYNDITEERDKELSRYQNLLDVASKAHLALDDDDKNQISNQINLLLGEQAKQEANKDKIMALAIDPSTAEAFFNSGASLDDTYEQILEKMSPFMSSFAKQRRLNALSNGTKTPSEIADEERKLENMTTLAWDILRIQSQLGKEKNEDKRKILQSQLDKLYGRVSIGDRAELNQMTNEISTEYSEILDGANKLVNEVGLEQATSIINADTDLSPNIKQAVLSKLQEDAKSGGGFISGLLKNMFLNNPLVYGIGGLFKK